MKKLLNTLYVTTQGAWLCHEGESVLVRVESETRLRVPVHTISSIVCFGQVLCSGPLMGLCAERGVHISYLSERGQFFARVEGGASGNVLLRREQHRVSEDGGRTLEIARNFVIGKIANSRAVLQRAARDHAEKLDEDTVETAIRRLAHLIDEVRSVNDLEVLRGKEGDSARVYFGVFNHLITAQKESFLFSGRSRRPPMDNINALLSFIYTILVHDAEAALKGVGLDPQVGFLHALRPGRPSLALDLIEEFRPVIADRLALSMINLRQVQANDFEKQETGAVLMSDKARKELLLAYQNRKQEEIQHPFTGEKVAIGLLMHLQALLLARHLRGDLDGYPPFLWK